MPKIESNGLQLEIKDYGKASDPAVLLIMGLAAQLTLWPPAFVQALVDDGFRVIAFDNRDIGLSEKLSSTVAPPPLLVALLNLVGLAGRLAPYKLTDMATDTIGLLDALDINAAHVIGASMGGMIGQIVCAEHPKRIKSFTAIMSSTNNPDLPRAHPAVSRQVFFAREPSENRDELIDYTLRIWQLIGSKDGGRDEEEFRQQIADHVDRSTSPSGVRRQIAAILATGDLRQWTPKIEAPSLVIHGSDDPLVPVQCGRDIAASIENSRFEIIEGMGHDLPPRYTPTIARHILGHLRSAEKKAASVRAA